MEQYSKETCGPFTFSELQPQDCGQMSFFPLLCTAFHCLLFGWESLLLCGSSTHTVSHVGHCSGDTVGGTQQEF